MLKFMKKILFISICLLIIIKIFPQENNDVEYEIRSFQAMFVPPLGTNGAKSENIINNLSFNVLVGYNGGVDGLEIGSFININKTNVDGAQFGGFGNFNGGNIDGLQIAGFGNINEGAADGFQGAGLNKDL